MKESHQDAPTNCVLYNYLIVLILNKTSSKRLHYSTSFLKITSLWIIVDESHFIHLDW